MSLCFINTPFCDLEVCTQNDKIVSIEFVKIASSSEQACLEPLQLRVIQQMQDYFRLATRVFDVPLAPKGTDFQHRVWAQLCEIPVGQVRSYGEIAELLSTSPRAVGNACRKNPIPVIIPCHRVVSKIGIGGFVGATDGDYLTIKRRLLKHEGVEIE